MAQIDETIASYLTAPKIEGKTPKTIESYANSLKDFRKVGCRLGLPETVEEYGVEQIYQFLGALQERGASPGYQHRRHREVQTLFSWCVRMGIVEQNVFKRVPRVKVGEKIKPPFTSAGPREPPRLPELRDHPLPARHGRARLGVHLDPAGGRGVGAAAGLRAPREGAEAALGRDRGSRSLSASRLRRPLPL